MKNLSLLFLVSIFISCSSSDDTSNNSNQFFNPPTWIQGTWGQINQDPYIEIPAFTFTDDDFCALSSFTETCFKDSLTASVNAGGNVYVDETITSDSYEFSVSQSSQTTNFEFIKISDNSIELVNQNQGLPNTTLFKLQ